MEKAGVLACGAMEEADGFDPLPHAAAVAVAASLRRRFQIFVVHVFLREE